MSPLYSRHSLMTCPRLFGVWVVISLLCRSLSAFRLARPTGTISLPIRSNRSGQVFLSTRWSSASKEIKEGRVHPFCTFETDDCGNHKYQVEMIEEDTGKTVLFCEASTTEPGEPEGLILLPEPVEMGKVGHGLLKTVAFIFAPVGDELVLLLFHEISAPQTHSFHAEFKPPFSTVVYLELSGESQGEGRVPLRPSDSVAQT